MNKYGNEISTTQVNQPFRLIGLLAYGPRDAAPNPIGGAKVDIYGSVDGNTWLYYGHTTTAANGLFAFNFPQGEYTPTGVDYFKITYDGDDQYASCVSNVVQLTVYK